MAYDFRFLETEVIPQIEDVFRDLRPILQFYMTPKNFKSANLVMEPGVFL